MSHIPGSADLMNEMTFTVSRSSGPGGQNVNKVNSRVTLKWDIVHSAILNEDQRRVLSHKLASRLTKDGVLLLSVQDNRSQLQNKEEAMRKLDFILLHALTPRKARKATKPSKAAKHKRIKSKKLRSEKKQWRQKI